MLDEAQGIYQGKNKGARNEKFQFYLFFIIFTDVVGTTILTITRVENES